MDSIVHTESLPLLPPPLIPHSHRRQTIAAGPEMDEAKTSPEKKDPSRLSLVKAEQQPSASPEKGDRPSVLPGRSEEVRAGSSSGKRDERIRRPKIIEKDLCDASPGKSEGLQADSSPEKMDERSRHQKIVKDPLTDLPGKSEEVPTESLSGKMDEPGRRREIEEKGILTASPEISEGVPAESSSVGKDPTPASPGESDGVPEEDASSPANRVSSSAHPGKSAEIAAGSSPRKSEGPSAESSAEMIVRSVDKGKALVVESDEVVKSALSMAGSDLPPLLPKVDNSFLDADSQDSSPGSRHRSTYKGKAVVINSGEGIERAARVGGSDVPRLLRNVDTSFLDCDDEGDKASEENSSKAPRLVGDQEPMSAFAAEYETSSPLFQENIKLLIDQYAAFRRTLGDGNCFFRAFMFAYLENILESQDVTEVARVKENINQCKITLNNLGFEWYILDDTFDNFLEVLDSVIQGTETSVSAVDLLIKARTPEISDYVVMFLRFVTAAEIWKRVEFFAPFLVDCDGDAEKFCKMFVLPMEKESDQIHITALCSALGVPIRVIYLDRAPSIDGVANVLYHGFLPSHSAGSAISSEDTKSGEIQPLFTLLSRPGHYDILYTKK